MRIMMLPYACLLGVASVTASSPASESLERQIGRIAEVGLSHDPAIGLELLEEVDSSVAVIEEPFVESMCAVVSDPSVHGAVRIATLDLLCRKVAPKRAANVAVSMRDLARRYSAERQTGRMANTGREELFLVPHLVRQFVASSVVELAQRLDDQSLLLDFYIEIVADPAFPYEDIRREAASRIADNPANKHVRKDYAYRAIRENPQWVAPGVFDELMDDAFADRLRPLLLTGEPGIRSFNYLALGLLSEYGDRDTARQLRQWIAAHEDPQEAARRVSEPLWKIDAQGNPQMLLDYIRSDKWDSYTRRVWALKTALRVGVPPEQIRMAILEHAPKALNHRGLKHSLQLLKREALLRGVLRPDDLPEVEPPPKNIAEALQRVQAEQQ
ncbi:MAG TPA: hypothetical protein VM243_15380 [Phycisphaerae bacterium]|nr:hypothetical protein [Phycisphaerae bacterium]